MRITFNNIRLNNFMSFGDEFVQLDNLGYVLVSGKNECPDDASLSNGSGKSSIWEGIVWALTGETIRGHKSVVNLFGNDGAVVTLDFNVDDKNYVIQRSKDHSKLKSSLYISVDGQDISGKGIRDSEAILKQRLPDLTSSLISSVIILGQGLPQRFSNNTPSGRKQVLEELSKSDFMIEDLKQRVSERKNTLNSSLHETEKNVLTLSTKKEMLSKQLADVEREIEALRATDINQLRSECETAQQRITSIENEMRELSLDIDDDKRSVDSLKEAFYAKRTESATKVSQINASYSDQLTSLSVDVATVGNDILTSKKELSRLKGIKDVCPTCGQKLLGVTKPDTTELENHIKELEEKNILLQEQRSQLDKKKKEELEINDQNFSAELNNLQKRLQDTEKEIVGKDSKNKTLDKEKETLSKQLLSIQHTIATVDADMASLQSKVVSLTNDISVTEGELLYYNNEQENTKAHVVAINKIETVIKRDFRGCLLKNVIDFIDNRAKKYAQVVFNNNLLEFKQEGNNISISFDNKEYESLSGGEQKKLDVIIQLAIRDMLCHLINFSSNILVCDEIFDALDITGCQKVLDLISSDLEDISSVFIVTHRDNLCIPCDNEIHVIKDANKISHVIQKA